MNLICFMLFKFFIYLIHLLHHSRQAFYKFILLARFLPVDKISP
ncbi:hypothetical protein CSC17_2147 [Klebsiella oxytoca]|nr:hypothetical protein CSC17_2147 [Klebsiella oxytoca]